MSEMSAVDLVDVNADLVKMTELVGRAISDATSALLNGDLALAQQVISGDEPLNELNAGIEDKCFLITSTQAPVARKLRTVMSAVRMATSLERMGDLAVHIAKQVRLRYPNPAIPAELVATFSKMGTSALKIVQETGKVIQDNDASMAEQIAIYDDELDKLHRELFMTVLSDSWEHGVEAAIDVTLLSRFYERFGDHAVTVARRLVHIVTGEPYGH
ncbi:MAG: phosphate transport system regulatory protein PhoU [Actinobacteria bacterium]|nr:phosphate transport system regulatory protein PhoU [Actinomycetota bacterium]NBY15424.1 phosphate transport system regulatory protein PhoU [Actinomycetota bacterium]